MIKCSAKIEVFYKIVLLLLLCLAVHPAGLQAGVDTTATWKFKTGGAVYSSPTYDSGSVYIGSDDGYLYKLDAETGSMIWKFRAGGLIRCTPALKDSVVFFESDDGFLHALDKNTGTEIWGIDVGNNVKRVLPDPSTSTGNYWDYMQSSPCVDSGVVYVGSGDSSFYAVNADSGTLQWKTKTGGIIRSSPCVYQDIVYVGSWDGFIYALKKSDGTVVWKYDTQANGYKNVQPSPRIYNGVIYCGSRSGYFCALDAITGSLAWKYVVDPKMPWVESSAALVDGVAYVGSSDIHAVHAINASTGKLIWKTIVQGDPWSSPFYYHGTVYIGFATYGNPQNGGGILAIDAQTGKTRWQLNCDKMTTFMGGVVSSPTVEGHTIFYGSLDGNVYAVDTAYIDPATDVKRVGDLPRPFRLDNNFPNPFNPATSITYQLPVVSHVTLKIFDLLRREMATLVNEKQKGGRYSVKFDGAHFPSGVYFYRLTAGGFTDVKKFALIK